MKDKIIKKIIPFLLLSFFLLLSSCDISDYELTTNWTKGKQMAIANDSLIPDSLKTFLREDAALLALRDVHIDPQSKNSLIIIPQELIDFYYYGLVHVLNTVNLPQRDSVFLIHKIHAFHRPQHRSIIIAVDSNKSWINNWRAGNRLTGNPKIDELVLGFELSLVDFYTGPIIFFAVLESPKPINIYALTRKFITVDGVMFAEENMAMGDGNDIAALIEQNYLTIEFSKGWGDCPAGCIYRHYWLFNIKFDGSVSFVRSYGDVIP